MGDNYSELADMVKAIDMYSTAAVHGSAQVHTHTRWFLWFTGTLHRRNGFYTVQTLCAIALHLHYT